MQKGGEKKMDKKNGFGEKEKPKVLTLGTVADSVDVMSNQGLITLTFTFTKLDKSILPNHRMIVGTVIIEKTLASVLAEALHKHANRGNIDAVAKKIDLPEGFKLPEKK